MTRSTFPIADLSLPLDEAVETLSAIRAGAVDALVVQQDGEHEVRLMSDPGLAYRLLIEHMNEGAAILTEGGVISYANAWLERLAGVEPGALVGRALADFVAEEQRGDLADALADERAEPRRIESRLAPPRGGEPIPVQISLALAHHQDVTLFCAVITDLRAHRLQEARYEAARAAIEARDRLVSIAAHELRSPLQGILIAIGTINRRLNAGAPDEPWVKDTLLTVERADRQARRLSVLVDVLMDVATVERGMALSRAEVDLGELARVVVDRHTPELRAAGYTVDLDVDVAIGRWDRVRIEQVISNLVSNAIKYGRGKPLTVRVEADAQRALLIVADQGDGIPHTERERVFQPFQRNAADPSVPGLGLGLFVSREIVRAHGGEIRIEGEPDRGTTFVVELPLVAHV